MPNKTQRALSRYRTKRDFTRTPEPDAAAASRQPATPPRFVIQEHHASHLHWDLRLEHNGVLLSWAVPKGLPLEPKVNRLAVQTEDHPLAYLDFAGDIPKGNYGAGQMLIWDEGVYEPDLFKPDKVIVTLHGQRVHGKYALFRTRGKNWMIHRMDPPQDPAAEPMPEDITPMLAKPAHLPADDQHYAFEIKWDGVRTLAYIEGGRARFVSRNLLDVTSQYPELRALGAQLGARRAVLDGEIVALDEHGVSRFERLQPRLHVTDTRSLRRLPQQIPVTYMIFDVIYLDGHSLFDCTYTQRRTQLEALALAGHAWQTPGYHVGDGAAMLAASRAQGLEGVIAKRLDSRYEPGKRSGAWLKIKNQRRQEFVIGGWTRGARHPIGSLLIGYYDITPEEARRAGKPQRLIYAGGVGTGFDQAMLDKLYDLLLPLKQSNNPFNRKPPKTQVTFVEPKHVGEVEFTEWTRSGGTLRHPSFKGLRPDKPPKEVVREPLPDARARS